jgi:glutamate-1-semialdehyde 2,1-aminomutase
MRADTRAGAVTESALLMERARRSIAGGDSSTMRVLPYHLPLVAERGRGSRVWDAEGREYIDLNMAYGPLILGHCPPRVVEAVGRQLSGRGSQLGFPTEITVRVAEKIKALFPSIELLRFANSGTEAVASAVRLARVHTGAKKLVIFEGHYHGWSEAVFNRYHADLAQLPYGDSGPAIPGTRGMTPALDDVIVVRWNHLGALHRVLEEHGPAIAGVLMEPVMGNAGVIPPNPGFLLGARELTRKHGTLLLFDEVITGMRVAPGGAQEHYDVSPDITILSKALGGGYPVAAFGASAEIMQPIVEGSLFHGGVFSGNALVMAAAEAVLDEILENRETLHRSMHRVSDALVAGLHEILTGLGVPHIAHHVGPMISLFLTDGQIQSITSYRDVRAHGDFSRYVDFQHRMQRSGVYFHPNMFEPMYLSSAHTLDDIDAVLERISEEAPSSLAA